MIPARSSRDHYWQHVGQPGRILSQKRTGFHLAMNGKVLSRHVEQEVTYRVNLDVHSRYQALGQEQAIKQTAEYLDQVH